MNPKDIQDLESIKDAANDLAGRLHAVIENQPNAPDGSLTDLDETLFNAAGNLLNCRSILETVIKIEREKNRRKAEKMALEKANQVARDSGVLPPTLPGEGPNG